MHAVHICALRSATKHVCSTWFLAQQCVQGAVWVSCKEPTQLRHGHDSCFYEATMNKIALGGQRKQQASNGARDNAK